MIRDKLVTWDMYMNKEKHMCEKTDLDRKIKYPWGTCAWDTKYSCILGITHMEWIHVEHVEYEYSALDTQYSWKLN